jgi:tyrosine-protein kinase Etk/Wzc
VLLSGRGSYQPLLRRRSASLGGQELPDDGCSYWNHLSMNGNPDQHKTNMQFITEEELSYEATESVGLRLLRGATDLLRHKRMIGLLIVCGIVAGVALSLVSPVRYTATTRIMTPQQAPSSAVLMMNQLNSSGVNSLAAAAGGGLSLKNPNDLYVGLLHSRPVADAIIQKFDLVKVYRAQDMTAARKKLDENATVISERSGLLAISVTDRDRSRAADIANGFTDQLRVLTKTLALTEASQRRLFYEEQLKTAKEDVINAQMAFQEVQQNRGLVQLDAQAKAMISGLADLRARIVAKQVELEALRSFSTEQNPAVALAERELSAMQSEAERPQHGGRSSGSSNLALQDLAGTGMEYLRAEHELQYRQTLFDLLVRQYDAARLDEAKYAAVIQIVETAIPPDRRSSPRRALIVLFTTVLVFAVACLYVLLAGYIRKNGNVSNSLRELRSALFGKMT